MWAAPPSAAQPGPSEGSCGAGCIQQPRSAGEEAAGHTWEGSRTGGSTCLVVALSVLFLVAIFPRETVREDLVASFRLLPRTTITLVAACVFGSEVQLPMSPRAMQVRSPSLEATITDLCFMSGIRLLFTRVLMAPWMRCGETGGWSAAA